MCTSLNESLITKNCHVLHIHRTYIYIYIHTCTCTTHELCITPLLRNLLFVTYMYVPHVTGSTCVHTLHRAPPRKPTVNRNGGARHKTRGIATQPYQWSTQFTWIPKTTHGRCFHNCLASCCQ